MSKAQHLKEILESRVLEDGIKLESVQDRLRAMGKLAIIRAKILSLVAIFFAILFVISVISLPSLFLWPENWRIILFVLTGSFMIVLATVLWGSSKNHTVRLLKEAENLRESMDSNQSQLEVIEKVI